MTDLEATGAGPAITTGLPSEIVAGPLLVFGPRAVDVRAAWSVLPEARAAAASPGYKAPPRYATDGGTAIISVSGALVNAGDIDISRWGYTSYGWLAGAAAQAAADPAVHSVVLKVNSPGGMVTGIEGAADAVRALAVAKPTVAVVEGMAASAGYWLASQASSIAMTPLSEVGSIGVWTAHVDYSGMLEQMGLDVTVISSGRHKVDGSPYEPLPDSVRAEWQTRIDDLRSAFAEAVSRGRGQRLSAAAALSTEARMYPGAPQNKAIPDAISAGLADRIGALEGVISDLNRAHGGRITVNSKGNKMTDTNGAPAASTEAGISKADHTAAIAAARTEGHADGVKAANDRIAAVAAHEGIKGNPALLAAALDLAMKSPGMSAEDVASFVVANIPAKAPAAAEFERRMASNPANSVDAGPAGGTSAEPWAKGAAIATAYNRYTGAKKEA